jgi:NO-binding membrane sensor protein with MHYT domain
MLTVVYDPLLVASSVVVAIMAAFTGLRLTSGLSQIDPARRRPRIAQAAVALGGGIWSMHFIGMLAVSVGVHLSYGALQTLASALIAILVVGTGLIALHFGARTQVRIVVAGVLTGLGIVAMHFVGMSAINGNCIVTFRPEGVILSMAIGVGASILALELAYRKRTVLMTAAGAVALGLAIAAMHYAAMAFTIFQPVESVAIVNEPNMTDGTLALIVLMAAFVICGLFLLQAIPLKSEDRAPAPGAPLVAADAPPPPAHPRPGDAALSTVFSAAGPNDRKADPVLSSRIPYQRGDAIRFFLADQVSAVCADGHYTKVLNVSGEHFCPWSISRVEKAVIRYPFMRTHRSYLVNLRHVAGFRRDGDKAYCLLDGAAEMLIPVSRSRVADVQKALGLS